MKYRLSFEFESDADPKTLPNQVLNLLIDALGEFREVRRVGHEEDYLAERYPATKRSILFTLKSFQKKLEEVKTRNRLASALKTGVHKELTVHEVID